MPPEGWAGEVTAKPSCDIYEFAILLYEMTSGKDPWPRFSGDPVAIICQKVRIDNARPNEANIKKSTPPEIIVLMTDCWKREPEERPYSSEVLQRSISVFKEGYMHELPKADKAIQQCLSNASGSHIGDDLVTNTLTTNTTDSGRGSDHETNSSGVCGIDLSPEDPEEKYPTPEKDGSYYSAHLSINALQTLDSNNNIQREEPAKHWSIKERIAALGLPAEVSTGGYSKPVKPIVGAIPNTSTLEVGNTTYARMDTDQETILSGACGFDLSSPDSPDIDAKAEKFPTPQKDESNSPTVTSEVGNTTDRRMDSDQETLLPGACGFDLSSPDSPDIGAKEETFLTLQKDGSYYSNIPTTATSEVGNTIDTRMDGDQETVLSGACGVDLSSPNSPDIAQDISAKAEKFPTPQRDGSNYSCIPSEHQTQSNTSTSLWRVEKEIDTAGDKAGLTCAWGIGALNNGGIAVTNISKRISRLRLYDGDGICKSTFSWSIKDSNQFPFDVALNSSHQLVVVDTTQYANIYHINNMKSLKSCIKISTLARTADHPNTDVCPQSVTVTPLGKIAIGDTARRLITIHRESTKWVPKKVEVPISPSFFRDDNDKFIAVIKYNEECPGQISPYTGHIHVYTYNGLYKKCIIDGLYCPNNITMSKDGCIYVANETSVLKLTAR